MMALAKSQNSIIVVHHSHPDNADQSICNTKNDVVNDFAGDKTISTISDGSGINIINSYGIAHSAASNLAVGRG